jgi:hypothetical protein
MGKINWSRGKQRQRGRQGLTLEVLEGRIMPSFAAPLRFPAGKSPEAVVVEDFNGDGIPDVATANSLDNTVSVLLGNGDGTFQHAINAPTGATKPMALAAAHLRRGGTLDLVTANDAGTVSILRGNGDGTFQAAVTYASGSHPDAVAVADLTGSGVADLVVANAGSDDVSVLLGNGDGTFQAAKNYDSLGSYPASVAVGDFDGDGHPDLVVANQKSNTVSVLLGNGDGSFRAGSTYTVQYAPASVAVGAFRGNGVLDVAVAASINSPGFVGRMTVLLGNGDGTFQAPVNYATAWRGTAAVAVADVNGDGVPDIVAVNASGNATMSVFLGNGDGSFQGAISYLTGTDTFADAVAVADLTGTGVPDLVTANRDGNDVSVLLGQGNGSFQTTNVYTLPATPYAVATGDLTGNGILDLVTADYQVQAVSVLRGNGDGTFQAPVSFPTGPFPNCVAVADLNGDGIPDLITANYDYSSNGSVSVLLGNGDGTFQAPQTFATDSSTVGVAVGDFNGDGIPDLVTVNRQHSDVSVLRGNGDGTFQAPVRYPVGLNPEDVVVADLQGDGVLGLITANYNAGTVSVLRGNGDGTFQPAVSYAVGAKPTSVVVGDFTGNGVLDLAVTNDYTGGGIYLLWGNGDGTFQSQATKLDTGGVWTYGLAAADFNHDGVLDLVAGSGSVPAYKLNVLLGNGDGSFQAPTQVNLLSYTDVLVTGDFEGNGFPDVAVATGSTYSVCVARNDGNWSPTAHGAPSPHVPQPGARPEGTVARTPGDRVFSLEPFVLPRPDPAAFRSLSADPESAAKPQRQPAPAPVPGLPARGNPEAGRSAARISAHSDDKSELLRPRFASTFDDEGRSAVFRNT